MAASNLLKKVVVWRLISILLTLAVIYAATGDVKSSTGLTLFLHTVLTSAHYSFEKLWQKRYGK
tara:strand:- start:610 stop:801 length:192 start_codon:yes stop_codon:yes gene_type:complete